MVGARGVDHEMIVARIFAVGEIRFAGGEIARRAGAGDGRELIAGAVDQKHGRRGLEKAAGRHLIERVRPPAIAARRPIAGRRPGWPAPRRRPGRPPPKPAAAAPSGSSRPIGSPMPDDQTITARVSGISGAAKAATAPPSDPPKITSRRSHQRGRPAQRGDHQRRVERPPGERVPSPEVGRALASVGSRGDAIFFDREHRMVRARAAPPSRECRSFRTTESQPEPCSMSSRGRRPEPGRALQIIDDFAAVRARRRSFVRRGWARQPKAPAGRSNRAAASSSASPLAAGAETVRPGPISKPRWIGRALVGDQDRVAAEAEQHEPADADAGDAHEVRARSVHAEGMEDSGEDEEDRRAPQPQIASGRQLEEADAAPGRSACSRRNCRARACAAPAPRCRRRRRRSARAGEAG